MKFIVVRKQTIRNAIIVVLTAVVLSLNFSGTGTAAQVFFGYAPRKIPVYSVNTAEMEVAITFDSAWGADKTLKILETLKEHGAEATFFLVGFWVEDYPDMVKALYDQGIEIGTHSNTHPDMVKLSEEDMRSELTTSMNLIKGVTGEDVTLFRAPFGSYNNTLLTVTESLGLQTIQWDVDTLDWKGISAMEITTRVLNKVKNGSIILCHNNSDHILEALPVMLERLKMKGYKVTSVGNLIYKDNYTIDNNGVQHKK